MRFPARLAFLAGAVTVALGLGGCVTINVYPNSPNPISLGQPMPPPQPMQAPMPPMPPPPPAVGYGNPQVQPQAWPAVTTWAPPAPRPIHGDL